MTVVARVPRAARATACSCWRACPLTAELPTRSRPGATLRLRDRGGHARAGRAADGRRGGRPAGRRPPARPRRAPPRARGRGAAAPRARRRGGRATRLAGFDSPALGRLDLRIDLARGRGPARPSRRPPGGRYEAADARPGGCEHALEETPRARRPCASRPAASRWTSMPERRERRAPPCATRATGAPQVVAAGRGHVAERSSRARARRACRSARPRAGRALAALALGHEVPEELWTAVARGARVGLRARAGRRLPHMGDAGHGVWARYTLCPSVPPLSRSTPSP